MAAHSEYHLILFDTSAVPRAVAEFVSLSPFHAVHVGDRFDDTGWERLDGVGVIASPEDPIRYTVHSIKHLVSNRGNTAVVSYCLNLQPHEGPSSPVWG